MNTEITDNPSFAGWILYDGECCVCVNLARRFREILEPRGFRLEPLQTAWARERLGLAADVPPQEMTLITPSGKVVGGADALCLLAGQIWWARPLWWLGKFAAGKRFLRHVYRWIAGYRYCANGACHVLGSARPAIADNGEGERLTLRRDDPTSTSLGRSRSRPTFWLPLAILSLLALALSPYLPAWGFMWTMAGAIYFGLKWLTYRYAIEAGRRARRGRAFGYLFAWPGMDAEKFLDASRVPARPAVHEWIVALAHATFGGVLLWMWAPIALPAYPVLAGWLAMVGIVLTLHFGVFHLLSVLWRHAGVDATPIMNAPILATSLSEFWGLRWNRAFRDVAVHHLLAPLKNLIGLRAATLTVFMISGLVHELVISLPACGGYGLPTAYFALQAFALVFERSDLGRRCGLARGWRGWLFTFAVTAAPAYALFHPTYIHEVILPFLDAIGAT